MLDGYIARRMKLKSEIGAKLDSLADLVFILVILFVIIRNMTVPLWVLYGVVVITLIRIVSYAIGYYKFHTFVSLHTIMNKISGFLLLGLPIFYALLKTNIVEVFTVLVAFVSAIEELIIILSAKKLERNCKSILLK